MFEYIRKAVKDYYVHSYLYYIEDTCIVSDHEYDEICQLLFDNYETALFHDEEGLLDLEALQAGSGYHISEEDYPQHIIAEAHERLVEYEDLKEMIG